MSKTLWVTMWLDREETLDRAYALRSALVEEMSREAGVESCGGGVGWDPLFAEEGFVLDGADGADVNRAAVLAAQWLERRNFHLQMLKRSEAGFIANEPIAGTALVTVR